MCASPTSAAYNHTNRLPQIFKCQRHATLYNKGKNTKQQIAIKLDCNKRNNKSQTNAQNKTPKMETKRKVN